MPKKSFNYIEFAKTQINNMTGGNLNIQLDQNNLIVGLVFAISIYIFAKSPQHLVGFLAHPFSLTALLLGSLYYFKENNIPLAVVLGLLMITAIVTKKENDIQNIMPILNREHFTDGNDDDEESEEEEDEEEEEEEEEFSDDDDESEAFVGKKYSSKNMNDTFKNLHDAIHQLENFISSSEA